MTPEQKNALIEACESGNDVRIVTIALQIAASAARDGRQDDSLIIRNLVDNMFRKDGADRAYRQMRLDVAKRVIPEYLAMLGYERAAKEAVSAADALLHAVATIEVPK